VSTGPVSWVRFDDRITVTGEGELPFGVGCRTVGEPARG
jgi:hypothetical protein